MTPGRFVSHRWYWLTLGVSVLAIGLAIRTCLLVPAVPPPTPGAAITVVVPTLIPPPITPTWQTAGGAVPHPSPSPWVFDVLPTRTPLPSATPTLEPTETPVPPTETPRPPTTMHQRG